MVITITNYTSFSYCVAQVAEMAMVDKMPEEKFADHCVKKLSKFMESKVQMDGCGKMYEVLDQMTNNAYSFPGWTKAEEERGHSFYTLTDPSSFTDPSSQAFKAWMVGKLRYVKDGIDNAKMEVMAKFSTKDGIEKISNVFLSQKFMLAMIFIAITSMFIDEKISRS